jgi:acyl-coenzyme A thioesterase PaaI-like protein
VEQRLKEYPLCYGCGAENPGGLRLALSLAGGRLTAAFTGGEAHQGWPGTLHGGVISALLYEVMANLPRYLGARDGDPGGEGMALRSSHVAFRRPAPLGAPLTASAGVVERAGRVWSLEAELRDAAGTLLATATGEAVRPRPRDAAAGASRWVRGRGERDRGRSL